MSKLIDLVNEISVPKSQYNSFGKYHFRNNEDIETALKPLLKSMGLFKKSDTNYFNMGNEILCVVKHVISDPETGEELVGIGGSVIDLNKKGMDKGQASGGAMSYASKYAYGQALMLDDVKDSDYMKGQTQQQAPQAPQQPSKKYKMSDLNQRIAQGTMTKEQANALYKQGLVINDIK